MCDANVWLLGNQLHRILIIPVCPDASNILTVYTMRPGNLFKAEGVFGCPGTSY